MSKMNKFTTALLFTAFSTSVFAGVAQADDNPVDNPAPVAQSSKEAKGPAVNMEDNVHSVETWDKLALVSSNADWTMNRGGVHGGLAISEKTWKDYGGEAYANLPHEASKEEQIEIAEKIQAAQGWSAWQSASLAGLFDTPVAPVADPAAPVVSQQAPVAQNAYVANQGGYVDNTQTYQESAPAVNNTYQETYQAPAQQAAPVATGNGVWDALAQCESGGNPTITDPSGTYSGLYQFDQQTWQAYGGGQYASTAGQASPEQQLEIAQKLQASRGSWGSWPACSQKLGLG